MTNTNIENQSAPSEAPDAGRCSVASGSPITITLPKEQVLGLLTRSIHEQASIAKVLEFNFVNAQWDLMHQNTRFMNVHSGVIQACAEALLANKADMPSGKP